MAGYVSPERKALQTKANIFCIIGLVLQFVVRLVFSMAGRGGGNVPLGIVGFIVAIAGLVCWMIGLSAYAQSKGYSSGYCLLGLLSCCGLLMVLLPNKWIDGPSGGYGSGDYPRPNA